MAPKKPTKTGGKAGAVPSRPGKPMAGLRDKTVRVPAAFNAKTVDPTNQRGAGQRITGGLAGGRAGKPAGKIAAPAPKPAAKPAASQRPALPSAGQTSGNQANAVKSARVARMQARRAAEAAAGKPSGVRQGQPAGAANRMYKANRVNAAVARAQQSQNPLNRLGRTVAKNSKGGVPKGTGAALSGVGEFANRVGRGESGLKALGGALTNAGTYAVGAAKGAQLGAKFGPYGAAAGSVLGGLGASQLGGATYDALTTQKPSKYGTRFKNAGTGASAAKGAKPTAKPTAKPAASTSRFAGARDKAMAKAKAIKGSPVVGPKAASAPARMSAPAARSSAPKATAPKASAPKATAPSGPARMSASTYNRMSGNYGTNRTNNPLMADFKDSLPSKAADPDAGYSPKTKVSSEGIKGAPTDVTKLAFSNPKLSAERTRKIKRG